jgi:hypothetical protein
MQKGCEGKNTSSTILFLRLNWEVSRVLVAREKQKEGKDWVAGYGGR